MSVNNNRTGALWPFVDKRLVLGIKPRETPTHSAARRALQVLGVSIAGIGKYPFVAIAKKAGGTNEAYGILLAYGNTASFASLISWALLNMIDDQMRPLSKEEAALLSHRQGKCRNALILSGSVVVGLVSQTPFAYLAYVYNGKKVEMPIFMMLSDSWFPTYSTYLSVNAVLSRKSFTIFEQELLKVRLNLVNLIEANRALLDNPEGRVDYVKALHAFKDQSTGNRSQKYLEHMLEGRAHLLKKEASCCEGPNCVSVGNTLSWLTGAVAFLSNMGAIGYVSYIGWSQIHPDPGFAGTFAALAVSANLYVNGTALPNTATRLYNLAKSIILCNYKPTLSDQLAPKLSFTLKALGLVTAGLSYGPSVQISKDYFGSNTTDTGLYSNEDLATYMEVANSCATILLTTTAILDIVDQIVALSLVNLGNEEARQLVEINENMLRLSYLLSHSPLTEFALFINALPPSIFNQVVRDTQITQANLESYIQENRQDSGELQPLMQD